MIIFEDWVDQKLNTAAVKGSFVSGIGDLPTISALGFIRLGPIVGSDRRNYEYRWFSRRRYVVKFVTCHEDVTEM